MPTPTPPQPDDDRLSADDLAPLIERHRAERAPSMARLWAYYRNPARRVALAEGGQRVGGARALAQACGLPARLRGSRLAIDDDRREPPEVVIENDIAWRIDALVNFAFGGGVGLESTAPAPVRRAEITRLLDVVWTGSGGAALLQDMGLLGGVHGFVDLALRWEELFDAVRRGGGGGGGDGFERAAALAARLRVELIEAGRAVPVVDPGDYRELRAHAAWWTAPRPGIDADGIEVLEVRTPSWRRRYEDGVLTVERPNPLGEPGVVHVQNASQPFRYEGLSDVEPLIPLQDELNTRLSDRAHRVTLQSFKMYLARGVEGFGEAPIGPGRVWATDNPAASIESFGGDGQAPSEDRHIDELRDAMDKTSGVSPVVLGVIREKLGHLSSENALRITFMGILSKTSRKRAAYGRAVERMSELILHALDAAGVYRTSPEERGVRLVWPDPLPIDESARLRAAQLKIELGASPERVLAELGLPGAAPGAGQPTEGGV